MPGPTLEYDTKATASVVHTPTRFEVAMQDERGRWLRRRFIGYCILSLVLTGISLMFVGTNSEQNQLWLSTYIIVSLFVVGSALVYAWKAPPKARIMIRVAVWLYILTSIGSLATNRILMEIELIGVSEAFETGIRHGFEGATEAHVEAGTADETGKLFVLASRLGDATDELRDVTEVLDQLDDSEDRGEWREEIERLIEDANELRASIEDTEPVTVQLDEQTTVNIAPGRVQVTGVGNNNFFGSAFRASISAGWALFAIIFFGHLVSCLIIPWNFRESLFPGLVVFNAFVLILIADIMFSGLPWWAAIIFIVLGLLALVPGSLWCFWRYTRFPKVFRTRYEADRYKQLSKDLSGARQIHEAVLPPQKNHGLVRLNYVYEPMSQIGGDLLYVRESEGQDGAVSAVLLDVTGHGVAAALTVNRLLGELDRIYGEDPDVSPGKVLAGLNHYVHLTLVRHGIFVTGLALRLEPNSNNGNLLYASAGHPPAFVCRSGNCDQLEPTTFMLGVMDEAGFDPNEQSHHLDPGDAVLVYTDGAAEARDERDRQIGTKGLEKLFHAMSGDRDPADWPKTVLGHVAKHRNRPPDDDTIVAAMYRAKDENAGD
ncbi:MAG: PP2C family protein-serine/threonine phosphatase [Planctomycetota bacterium]